MIRIIPAFSFAASLVALAPLGAAAQELTVRVSGIAEARGEIGCALHASGASFPTGQAGARIVWIKATGSEVRCRFGDIGAGSYAVAISHDLNGNRRTDTNFLGMPTEAWGVSNNVRPSLRAPRFEEARFETDGSAQTISVRIAK
ncbi:DUF2141 domain-containing protein [Rhizobium sp. CRIBSB]|nr:DUF2141 domain-containing protein [Rhizobium sp. CRIBSB]